MPYTITAIKEMPAEKEETKNVSYEYLEID